MHAYICLWVDVIHSAVGGRSLQWQCGNTLITSIQWQFIVRRLRDIASRIQGSKNSFGRFCVILYFCPASIFMRGIKFGSLGIKFGSLRTLRSLIICPRSYCFSHYYTICSPILGIVVLFVLKPHQLPTRVAFEFYQSHWGGLINRQLMHRLNNFQTTLFRTLITQLN